MHARHGHEEQPSRDYLSRSEQVANWGASGLRRSADRRLGLQDNVSVVTIEKRVVERLCREVVAGGCDGVAVASTKMRGAFIAETLERELN